MLHLQLVATSAFLFNVDSSSMNTWGFQDRKKQPLTDTLADVLTAIKSNRLFTPAPFQENLNFGMASTYLHPHVLQ